MWYHNRDHTDMLHCLMWMFIIWIFIGNKLIIKRKCKCFAFRKQYVFSKCLWNDSCFTLSVLYYAAQFWYNIYYWYSSLVIITWHRHSCTWYKILLAETWRASVLICGVIGWLESVTSANWCHKWLILSNRNVVMYCNNTFIALQMQLLNL